MQQRIDVPWRSAVQAAAFKPKSSYKITAVYTGLLGLLVKAVILAIPGALESYHHARDHGHMHDTPPAVLIIMIMAHEP